MPEGTRKQIIAETDQEFSNEDTSITVKVVRQYETKGNDPETLVGTELVLESFHGGDSCGYLSAMISVPLWDANDLKELGANLISLASLTGADDKRLGLC